MSDWYVPANDEPSLSYLERRALRRMPEFQAAVLAESQREWDRDVKNFGRDAIRVPRPEAVD